MSAVISVEPLSKTYRLGQVSTSSTRRIGTGMFRHGSTQAFSRDLVEVGWAKVRDEQMFPDTV